MRPGCRFPRTARIATDVRAKALLAAPRLRGRWFLVRRSVNERGYARLLVRVAKQVLVSAVARNRMRRCVREVFRQQREGLPAVDYLVSLIHPYEEADLQPARRELGWLLQARN